MSEGIEKINLMEQEILSLLDTARKRRDELEQLGLVDMVSYPAMLEQKGTVVWFVAPEVGVRVKPNDYAFRRDWIAEGWSRTEFKMSELMEQRVCKVLAQNDWIAGQTWYDKFEELQEDVADRHRAVERREEACRTMEREISALKKYVDIMEKKSRDHREAVARHNKESAGYRQRIRRATERAERAEQALQLRGGDQGEWMVEEIIWPDDWWEVEEELDQVDLSDRERFVLESRVFEHSRWVDLAAELSLSTQRICQIYHQAIWKIQKYLGLVSGAYSGRNTPSVE